MNRVMFPEEEIAFSKNTGTIATAVRNNAPQKANRLTVEDKKSIVSFPGR